LPSRSRYKQIKYNGDGDEQAYGSKVIHDVGMIGYDANHTTYITD